MRNTQNNTLRRIILLYFCIPIQITKSRIKGVAVFYSCHVIYMFALLQRKNFPLKHNWDVHFSTSILYSSDIAFMPRTTSTFQSDNSIMSDRHILKSGYFHALSIYVIWSFYISQFIAIRLIMLLPSDIQYRVSSKILTHLFYLTVNRRYIFPNTKKVHRILVSHKHYFLIIKSNNCPVRTMPTKVLTRALFQLLVTGIWFQFQKFLNEGTFHFVGL